MRKTIYAFLIMALAIYISGCSLFSSDSYIEEANRNMDINGLKLLMKENPKQDIYDKGLSFAPGGFGCNVYMNQSGDLRVIFSGFPDVLDEYMLTNIETGSPSYRFYGMGVGDSIKNAEEVLTKNGFTKKEPMRFAKNKLSVSFSVNESSKIIKMNISLSQTNKKGVVF